MRRKDREVSAAEAMAILDRCEYGVLATVCPDGTPYAFPINFAREGNSLYMHCAREGRKLENLAFQNRCSFTVVTDTQIHQDRFATDYSSAICFGTVEIVDGKEKIHALESLVKAHHPDNIENGAAYIAKAAGAVYALVFNIEEVSGKVCRVK